MKLFVIETNAGTDWIAANDEAEATRTYINIYGLHERDMEGVDVSLVDDPDTVEVDLGTFDDEDEEMTTTATEVMTKMKRPGLVCSTNV